MSKAHQKNPPSFGSPPVILADRGQLDRLAKDATAQLRDGLSTPPHPAWRFYDVAAGRYNPFATADAMLVGAIAAGQREENCWPFASVLTQRIEMSFRRIALPLPTAALQETIAQSAADPAQQRATLETENESILCEAERTTVAHIVAATHYLTAIRARRHQLAERRRSVRAVTVLR